MNLGLIELLKKDKHCFGVPNLLTVSRLFFIPFIVYFLSWQTVKGDWFALFTILASGLTDFFDGYFARHMDQRSQLGRMLDPVVDKILVAVLMLFLAKYKGLPYWYVSMVIGRDIIILIASVYLISKSRNIAESNLLGKLTLMSFLAVIMFYTINFYPVNLVVMWGSVVLIPSSLLKYFKLHNETFVKKNAPVKKNTILVEK
ncbi:MAG: hypothetical protein GWP06_00715 [Actinobacteria bacterium]|nr:hypothetical protein [Actinomycetota bacterium]